MATIELDAQFAYEETVRLGGGKDAWGSSHTLAMIMTECHKNETIRNLSRVYLYGSSERAEANLERLRNELRRVFGA